MTAINAETMLTGAPSMAIAPTTDLARAKAFHGEILGTVTDWGLGHRSPPEPRCCWPSRWRVRCWLIALRYAGISAEAGAVGRRAAA